MIRSVLTAIYRLFTPASAAELAVEELNAAEIALLQTEAEAERQAHSVKLLRARITRLQAYVQDHPIVEVPPGAIARAARSIRQRSGNDRVVSLPSGRPAQPQPALAVGEAAGGRVEAARKAR